VLTVALPPLLVVALPPTIVALPTPLTSLSGEYRWDTPGSPENCGTLDVTLAEEEGVLEKEEGRAPKEEGACPKGACMQDEVDAKGACTKGACVLKGGKKDEVDPKGASTKGAHTSEDGGRDGVEATPARELTPGRRQLKVGNRFHSEA
jgi:hypothetical protein